MAYRNNENINGENNGIENVGKSKAARRKSMKMKITNENNGGGVARRNGVKMGGNNGVKHQKWQRIRIEIMKNVIAYENSNNGGGT
jgi:hypothetical protein